MKLVIVFVTVLTAGLVTSATAQKINAEPNDKLQVKKIACWPSVYGEGGDVCDNQTAIKTCQETMQGSFQKLGLEQEDPGKVIGTIRGLNIRVNEAELPSPEDMLKLGKELKTDLVIACKWHWDVRSVTTLTGLKTKAYCTFTTIVVNVAKEEVEYRPEAYKCDSEKKLSNEEVVGFLFLSVAVPFFSGGPKTPHMQHSGQVAYVECLKPWLAKYQPGEGKIGK
ncbi:MAG TPA: hypothetical protein VMQ44_01000 [Candidatus Saccharimonadales bacterium]|nr:hypothetical protein [Candidatus Saccharimonadales bacterium]